MEAVSRVVELKGEILNDAHVVGRETVKQLQRADLGEVPSVRSPIRLRNSSFDCDLAPPALGDSTESILREMGLSDPEIEDLLVNGVVAKPPGS